MSSGKDWPNRMFLPACFGFHGLAFFFPSPSPLVPQTPGFMQHAGSTRQCTSDKLIEAKSIKNEWSMV